MTHPRLFAWAACLALVAVGCGGDSGGAGSEPGGRCVSAGACFEVIDPPNYSIQAECSATGGTWEPGTCQPIQYERRCTQDPIMSNGMNVTYVYYYMHTAGFVCTGPEEIL